MITLGAKFYFGLAAFGLIAAAILGLATDASLLGILSFGWSGPIGDQHGYFVLMGLALASFFMGAVTTAFRDADAEAVIALTGTEVLPAAQPPADLAPWPIVTAFGLTLVMIGLVAAPFVFGVGILVLVVATVEWTVTAWADRATGDPAANRLIRHRLMYPVEVPGASVLGVFAFVFFVSRILLSLSAWAGLAAFALAATAIIAIAAVLATRPSANRAVVTTVLVLGALAIVVGGLIGVGAGERDFHQAGGGGKTSSVTTDKTNDSETNESTIENDNPDADSDGNESNSAGDTEE